jgi:sugar diacid utilization regulator
MRHLAGTDAGGDIQEVAVIGELGDVAGPGPGALLVLMPSALKDAEPYEWDVAVRRSIERGHRGLVLVGPRTVPVTVTRLAERGRLPLLGVTATTDVAGLILWLTRIVRGGAADTVARAEAVLAVLAEHGEDGPLPELLAEVSLALGHTVQVRPATRSGSQGAVRVMDRVVGEVCCDHADRAADLVLPAIAAAVSRLKRRELELAFAPSQTRAELLAQIVVAEPAHLVGLAEQARGIGLPLDLTHVAAWLDLAPGGEGDDRPAIAARRRLLANAELLCLELLQPQGAWWHVVRVGGSLVLLCSDETQGPTLVAAARAGVEQVVAQLVEQEGAVVHIGLGTDQQGLGGIRQSAVEARSAAELAILNGRAGTITVLDTTGIGRVLADLYASPLSRRIMAEVIAPLDRLGPQRAATAVRTLTAYLDHQSSPTRAGRALHLHPNAVTYRMHQIESVLGVDLGDPDVRFGVHLACRLRSLALVAAEPAG